MSKSINPYYFDNFGPCTHPLWLPIRLQILFITESIGGMQFCTRKEIFNFSQTMKYTFIPFLGRGANHSEKVFKIFETLWICKIFLGLFAYFIVYIKNAEIFRRLNENLEIFWNFLKTLSSSARFKDFEKLSKLKIFQIFRDCYRFSSTCMRLF